MVQLYPSILFQAKPGSDGVVREAIDEACEEIRKATKGWGTNESHLINAVARFSPTDRFYAYRRYPEMYDGKDLSKLMKEECGGDFGTALKLITLPGDLADAYIVKKCTKGLGTTGNVLYQIVCGRTNAEIDLLKKTWFNKYGTALSLTLAGDLSGDFKLMIFSCIQGVEEKFDSSHHTKEKAEVDAEMFHKAGQKRWGTDEQKLFNIICHSPPEYLRILNYAYVDKYGYSLTKALEMELSGYAKDAAIYHVNMKLKPLETAAAQIRKGCAGAGTDEFALTCSIVQYHNILKEVDEAHKKAYDKSISDRIKSEVNGDYKKLLMKIVENA